MTAKARKASRATMAANRTRTRLGCWKKGRTRSTARPRPLMSHGPKSSSTITRAGVVSATVMPMSHSPRRLRPAYHCPAPGTRAESAAASIGEGRRIPREAPGRRP